MISKNQIQSSEQQVPLSSSTSDSKRVRDLQELLVQQREESDVQLRRYEQIIEELQAAV